MNGTSWLLGAGYSWQSAAPASAATRNVVASPNGGLALAAFPEGPLALNSKNGSLGGLTLPKGVAVAGTDVYILSFDGTLVYRYDHVRPTLEPIPGIGTEGFDGEDDESNIAALGHTLYVADPSRHRVLVFDVQRLVPIRWHTGLANPVDVASGRHGIYILDSGRGRVYRGSPDRDDLILVVDLSSKADRWTRIAIDRDERIYLYDPQAKPPALDMAEPLPDRPATQVRESFTDAASVRDRFDPVEIEDDGHGGFKLPDKLADPCGLRRPLGRLAKAWQFKPRLYVVDRERREIGVRMQDGRLLYRFGPYDGAGHPVRADAPDAWSPVDLAWVAGCVVILDQRHQAVYAHEPGSALLRRWFQAPADRATEWRRIAPDAHGCLLLWDGSGDPVDRVDARGVSKGTARWREVKGLFEAAANHLYASGPAAISPRLTRNGPVPRTRPDPPAPLVQRYRRDGLWLSVWLDSEIYNCQWHLLELSIAKLPPGSQLVIKTRTTNTKPPDTEAATAGIESLGSWAESPAIVGPDQPSPEDLAKLARTDLLVLSGPGEFIQVLVQLTGDGITTPILKSLRLRFPRESYLEYLPAIYSDPVEQREFLNRFLSVFQTTWGALEREVESFERYFDPASVPEGRAMRYLASWLALRLEGTWKEEQNRRLLSSMPRLLATWGTPAGLSAWIRVYLANLSGLEADVLEQAKLPAIVESFVDRRRFMLNRDDTATLGAAEGLWSPAVERRLQIGVFDREGDVELVSVGDPELDLFRHYAHGFRVFVPSAWVRTPADEALIRRAIGAQKPAHTTYELVLVEPRFRVGVQSTVELDTIIGVPFPTPLACAAEAWPASRPPRQALGFDTVLGCGSDGAALGSSDLILA